MSPVRPAPGHGLSWLMPRIEFYVESGIAEVADRLVFHMGSLVGREFHVDGWTINLGATVRDIDSPEKGAVRIGHVYRGREAGRFPASSHDLLSRLVEFELLSGVEGGTWVRGRYHHGSLSECLVDLLARLSVEWPSAANDISSFCTRVLGSSAQVEPVEIQTRPEVGTGRTREGRPQDSGTFESKNAFMETVRNAVLALHRKKNRVPTLDETVEYLNNAQGIICDDRVMRYWVNQKYKVGPWRILVRSILERSFSSGKLPVNIL